MGYKKNEPVGSAINSKVLDQIIARQNTLGNPSKNRGQTQYGNSNTSWIKLSSSINKISNQQSIDLITKEIEKSTVIGSPFRAQNYVLLGGTLNPKSKTPRSGILRGPESDDFPGRPAALNRDTEAYLNYESTGFRPMPGVTGMEVTSYNPYGTLLQANVTFNIWSKEQLEDAELLFFRPGYTVLLEWGNSVFVNNKGETEFFPKNGGVKGYFEGRSFQNIDEEIVKLRSDYHGNYDAMFGFISNFNWSFRQDGGYDCSVKIVSKGVILENLKSSNTTDGATRNDVKDTDTENTTVKFKSPLHYVFDTLSKKSVPEGKLDATAYLQNEAKYSQASKPTFPLFFTYGVEVRVQEQVSGLSWFFSVMAGATTISYINLRALCEMINHFFIFKDPKAPGNLLCGFYTEPGEKYRTFPQQFSLDPYVALLPKVPSGQIADTSVSDFVVAKGIQEGKSLNSLANDDIIRDSSSDDIMEILVSSQYLLKQFAAINEGPTEEGVGIFDVLKNILAGIQNAFGEINDFDIFFDHDINAYKIIDRGSVAAVSKNIPRINVTGLYNTVTNLDVSCTISSQIASQVSIAAQGNTGNYKENLRNILQWNMGAVDRHIYEKSVEPGTGDGNTFEKEPKKEYLKRVKDAYNNLAVNKLKINKTLNLEVWGDLKSEGIALFTQLYHKSLGKKVDPLPVPVVLELKLLGISGMKIGQTFRINDQVLPDKYKKFAYIITGISHSIGNDNKWYTNLKTQFYATHLK